MSRNFQPRYRAQQAPIRRRIGEAHAEKLQTAWDRLGEVTEKLNRLEDVDLRLANAAPYLEAYGHVVVGWPLLDQAIIAEQLMDGTPNGDFYRGKIASCDYHFGWEMPKVESWLAVLDPVETIPLSTTVEWL